MSLTDEPNGLFATLRAAVVERLAGAEEFAEPNAVPVINGGRGSLLDAVGKALQKRTAGLCLAVTVSRVDPTEGSPLGCRATVAVVIYERASENWSQKGRQLAAEDAAEAVMFRLGWAEGAAGWSPDAVWSRFRFAGMRIVAVDTDLVAMEVTFTTETFLQLSSAEES